MALITTAQYKTYAGITDTSLDSFLAVAIPAAQEIIETMAGRPAGGFESASFTENFDGDERRCFYVKCWPITAIASVSELSADGTATAMSTSDYTISPDSKAVCRTGAVVGRFGGSLNDLDGEFMPNQTGVYPQFVMGTKNYRIVYTGGYSTVPARLQWLMYRLVDDAVSSRRQPSTLMSESIGDYSYKLGASAETLVEVNSLLAEWTTNLA